MKKQTLLLIGIVIAVAAIVIVGQLRLGQSTNINLPSSKIRILEEEGNTPSPAREVKLTAVTIDFGDGKKITGQTQAQSAYESLVKIAREKGIKVEVQEYKYGVVVTQVGQTTNNDNWQWAYQINGKTSPIASDRYLVYPGDNVEWEYKQIRN